MFQPREVWSAVAAAVLNEGKRIGQLEPKMAQNRQNEIAHKDMNLNFLSHVAEDYVRSSLSFLLFLTSSILLIARWSILFFLL